MVKQKQVVMPSSKIKVGIAQILLQEGFIEGYTVTDEKPQPNLIVRLKYTPQGRSVIRGLERVSRPGRRYYAGFKDIPWVRSGLGINIISTPKGLMTGRRARRERLGGEILCNIW
jgi:small subunit ribosomal protein S8